MNGLLLLGGGINLFAAGFVAALSFLVLRLRPLPFFRAWAHGYLWTMVITASTFWAALVGAGLPQLATASAAAAMAMVWQGRMVAALLDRPFPAAWVYAAVAAAWAVGVGAVLAGAPVLIGLLPTLGLIVVTRALVAGVMLWVGRTPAFRGLGWLAVPVAIHAAWAATFPVVMGTPWEWCGHLIDAGLKLAEGVGLATYVLVRTVDDLAAADRLKQDFLDAASHELRAPLTTVVGYAELLADGDEGALNERQAAFVGRVRESAARLSGLVDDMLDAARVEAGAVELALAAADVGAIAAQAAERLRPAADARGVRLVVAPAADPLALRVDAARVAQVVANLVSNAVKFTPAGGEVRVAARRAGAGVRVEVADTGIGIDPTHLPRLFERFYQANTGRTSPPAGTGLGLAISKALVEAHGGTIDVESAPGRGARFWFELPG